MDTPRYLRLVRTSAWYDLLATGAFITPWSMHWVVSQLGQVSTRLGLGAPAPLLDPVHMLLANLLGSVVVVWALLRLCHTRPEQGAYDALARGLFAVWQVVAVANGASALVLGFTLMEAVFGVAQGWPWVAGKLLGRAPKTNVSPT
ncbi:hypothetical protein [Pseudomonas eucalypticola]|uniref:Uncharacterized protein n=1 Tax=Pseudomonas eucalypticola TaxID=2599595 RepID=A0A7D5D830_9PSED|nr:hypothetical protein [Pseudomonas eucalypticola]QKZ05137.1 hypothetical protein HWQ56_15605 [Pseudomonas eucalypticola]